MTIPSWAKISIACLAVVAFGAALLLAVAARTGIVQVLVVLFGVGIFAVVAALWSQKSARPAARGDREQMALFPERSPDPVLGLSVSGQVVYANSSAADMLKDFGKDPRDPETLLPADLQQRLAALLKTPDKRQTWEYPVGNRILACRIHFLPDGQKFHAYITDITRLSRAQAELSRQAHYDALTGLPNRRLFEERIEQALATYGRGSRTAVILMDVDRFNVIIRSLGHGVADGLLQAITARLEHLLREAHDITANASVYRFEADVFAILIPRFAGQHTPARLAERILLAMQRPLYVNTREYFMSFSIGISMSPRDGHDSISLLRNADTAMQRAKQLGGNNFQTYSQEMNARAAESLSMENYLRHALEHNELHLHFQPEIDISSGRIASAEVLLRWDHPERGTVMPAEFIPLAEETGTIVPIGEWALRAACIQRKAWGEAGLKKMTVAVNISARQFRQQNTHHLVSQALSDTGIDPGMLELEITEGVAMQDVEHTRTTLKQLKDIGVRISIDDFGTGFSSLSYLRRFPIDKLKIDQSFVRNLATNESDAAITRAIIGLGHSMKLEVVAEGIENAEQLDRLRQENCDIAQGFYLHPPLTTDRFEKLLQHDRRIVTG